MTQFSRRLSYATAAVAAAWLVSGVIFVSLIRGPGTVAAWLIWGTGIFATAWILVALPIVALGDRILRMSGIGLPLAAGAEGVFVIELPYLITRDYSSANPTHRMVRSRPGLAKFGIRRRCFGKAITIEFVAVRPVFHIEATARYPTELTAADLRLGLNSSSHLQVQEVKLECSGSRRKPPLFLRGSEPQPALVPPVFAQPFFQ
jgi:hypothetical protein